MSEEKIVKRISVFRYTSLLPETLSEAGDAQKFLLYSIELDKEGRELLKIEHDAEGQETEKMETRYNENGGRLQQFHYYEGELAETTLCDYNEAGLMIKETLSYTDGSSISTVYVYDQEKNLLEKRTADSDGEPESMQQYRYEKGLLVEEIKYDGDRNVLESYQYTYVKFGGKDKIQESVEWNAHDNSYLRTVNQFNEEGNYIASISYNKNNQIIGKHSVVEDDKKRVSESISEGPKEIIVRKFEYDEKDNLLAEERYRNSSLVYKLQQVFGETNALKIQSISDAQGYFTDMYEYEYY